MLAARRFLMSMSVVSWALLAFVSPGRAQDEEANLEFFYPVVTRRPIIERELEFRTRSAKGDQGAEHDFVGAIEYPILPWWQMELEVPVVAGAVGEDREGLCWTCIGHRFAGVLRLLGPRFELRDPIAIGVRVRASRSAAVPDAVMA